MALREVVIRESGNRVVLVMGGDRELVLLSCLCSFALIVAAGSLVAAVVGIALLLVALWILRRMAKSDPLLRKVYLRHRKYKRYYPARSTPFRVNTAGQGARYK